MITHCIESVHVPDKSGYVKFTRGGKSVYQHRLAYCQARGLKLAEIKGKLVLHTCDNRKCMNPEHLILGTALDNSMDMMAKGRNCTTHSPKGSATGTAKLTEADVLAIRSRTRDLQKDIAQDYGVSRQVISTILLRQAWKHI